ncbi:hypothetical protein [Citreimonas salinaria]|uniref:hypothetical protein n=1 Tax=Citreimonas salinaria TaxID=321339 RepID=UPI000B7EADEB|nr:hypothetical protein [Citreimonas salinaria]
MRLSNTTVSFNERFPAPTRAILAEGRRRDQNADPKAKVPKPRRIADGKVTASRKGRGLKIAVADDQDACFAEFIEERIETLFEEFDRSRN